MSHKNELKQCNVHKDKVNVTKWKYIHNSEELNHYESPLKALKTLH